MERLPLFPLNSVLFPGMPLPLHIFEERYKLMIGRCIEEHSPFGVVLIRSGDEVGGVAEPHDVGTTARIERQEQLDDGRMKLICAGERRFRIGHLDRSQPYLLGDVDFLSSAQAESPEAAAAADHVRSLYDEHFRLRLALSSQWMRRLDLPDAPDALADLVAGTIDVPPLAKQELLETLPVPARLRREQELLDGLLGKLTRRWEDQRRERFAGSVLN